MTITPAETNNSISPFLSSYFHSVVAVSRYEAIALRHFHEILPLTRSAADAFKIDYPEASDHPLLFRRVSAEMTIAHSVAIFDSFINSVSRYVMYKLPSKSLGDLTCEVRQLIAKPSHIVVKQELDKKADALSRQSFLVRFQRLSEIIGQRFDFPNNDILELKEIVRIRNLITHDSRSFSLELSSEGNVALGAMRNVQPSDFDVDLDALERLVPIIYRAVVKYVCKIELTGWEEGTCKFLEQSREEKRSQKKL